MVLRGNQIRPEESLPAVKQRLNQELDDYNTAKHLLEHSQLVEDKLHLEQLKRNVDSTSMQLARVVMQLLCGGTAGAVARSLVAPVDRIKILMQTAYVQNKQHEFPNMVKTAQYIVRTEGLPALWRGNFTNCVRVVPHTAVQFVAYDKLKLALVGRDGEKMTMSYRLLCGSLAGIVAATLTQPLDVVRIRLQTDPECQGKARLAIKLMSKEHGGYLNFFKGYTPAMLSLAPFIAVNFAAFDTLKTLWYGNDRATKQELQSRNPLVALTMGALSGVMAQSICYPLDTVRRRMQIKGRAYPNTPMAFVMIFRNEGLKGFYRGMTPNVIKIVPNNALRFAVYETLKNWLVVASDDHGVQHVERQAV